MGPDITTNWPMGYGLTSYHHGYALLEKGKWSSPTDLFKDQVASVGLLSS